MTPSHLASFGTPLSQVKYIQPSAEGKSQTINFVIQIAIFAGLLYVTYRIYQNHCDELEKTRRVNESNSAV
jgi:hypothetical protein